MEKYWYRIESGRRSDGVDMFDNPLGSSVQVYINKYEVLKETPKGVWLKLGMFSGKRFVLHSSKKRFACPTLAEALESFEARKTRHIRFLQARMDDAREALHKAERKVAHLVKCGYN